jgi:hypothetical protein
MNLRSKNGEDVLTLDAAERRCLEKAQGIGAKVAQILPDTSFGRFGGVLSEAAQHLLNPSPAAQKKIGEGQLVPVLARRVDGAGPMTDDEARGLADHVNAKQEAAT